MMVDSGGDWQFNRRVAEEVDEMPFVEDRLGIAEAAVLPYLWSRGIERLDTVVASHGDSDHVGGFVELVRNMRVGAAWQAPGEQGAFTPAMREAAVPVRSLNAGTSVEVDGVVIEVLSAGGAGNNGSLVLRLRFGGRSFLLTGDIERPAEQELVRRGVDLRADVLKVAHHGSRTSTTAEFLDRTAASVAVISAGAGNSFGHPHEEVVDRLRQRGLRILETSRHGAVTISTDGHDLRVELFGS
jgi:competence protein ComEC